ncbi:MAG: nucleotidyl transferase AbiEii/AbiGii toxin family protein [Patescibacteria group bacterium]|nr:nucleotidyl transferase AbiEii/AbiGii toxin family protein [Patescibacteria group bacterium]
MHQEVLNKKQLNFLPFLSNFSKEFFLVGGTAIALYLGHRKSIDFDLFSLEEINSLKIQKKITKTKKIQAVFINSKDEYTILVDDIKLTFLYYPFKFDSKENIDNIISLPDLETLAALKAYALGRRSKWKDYVDLYFILNNGISLAKIIKKANSIFKESFNEKIFRTQLAYFSDIDYSEKVDYIDTFKVDDKEIKDYLSQVSLLV